MARASMFWLLHIGHLMLPGQSVASAYDAYRTKATLLRSRVTKPVNTTRANLEHARKPVQPETRNLQDTICGTAFARDSKEP
eukprot:2154161-Pleurochrysis_carterae.AAC.2